MYYASTTVLLIILSELNRNFRMAATGQDLDRILYYGAALCCCIFFCTRRFSSDRVAASFLSSSFLPHLEFCCLGRSPIVPSSYQIAGDPYMAMAALVDGTHMTHVSHDRE